MCSFVLGLVPLPPLYTHPKTDGLDCEMEGLQSQKLQVIIEWSDETFLNPTDFDHFSRWKDASRLCTHCTWKWQQCSCIVMLTTGCHKVPADRVPAAKSQLSKYSNYKHSSCCCLYLLHCLCVGACKFVFFLYINAYDFFLFIIKIYLCLRLFCSTIDVPHTTAL